MQKPSGWSRKVSDMFLYSRQKSSEICLTIGIVNIVKFLI